jgi:hypothetical protein
VTCCPNQGGDVPQFDRKLAGVLDAFDQRLWQQHAA